MDHFVRTKDLNADLRDWKEWMPLMVAAETLGQDDSSQKLRCVTAQLKGNNNDTKLLLES
jgi:hypothetical protein